MSSRFKTPLHSESQTQVVNISPSVGLIDIGKRLIGRAALAFGIVAGLVTAEASVITPRPARANGGYPDWQAPCVANNRGVTQGTGYWCSGYQWGYYTRNSQGTITGNVQNSPRGYGYRNCTDWAAFRVAQLTGVAVPPTLGDAKSWNDRALGSWSKDLTPEVGDIAQSEGSIGDAFGHVGVVEDVTRNSQGVITAISVSEYNKNQDGNHTLTTYSPVNGIWWRNGGRTTRWDTFIDTNGSAPITPSIPPIDPLALSFVRLNHPSGNVEVVSYSESSNYQQLIESALSGYPAVPHDGNVVPLFQKDGDLSVVRLNHPSGRVEVATYSDTSGYRNLVGLSLTGYPSVPGDGAVIPQYQYDGDLSFIRLNHSSGNVEVVAYSEASNFQTLTESRLTSYPAVPPDGSVVPLYWLNDDLAFIRLNHYSGRAELASYSKASGYQQLVNYQLLPYPAVAPDGAVVPMFQPQDGDLSFVRLNHYSGHPEVITYGVGSGFQQLNDNDLVSYPAVPPKTGVVVRYSN